MSLRRARVATYQNVSAERRLQVMSPSPESVSPHRRERDFERRGNRQPSNPAPRSRTYRGGPARHFAVQPPGSRGVDRELDGAVGSAQNESLESIETDQNLTEDKRSKRATRHFANSPVPCARKREPREVFTLEVNFLFSITL